VNFTIATLKCSATWGAIGPSSMFPQVVQPQNHIVPEDMLFVSPMDGIMYATTLVNSAKKNPVILDSILDF